MPLILFLIIINYYNISVIHSTLARDDKSLAKTEMFLSYFCHRLPSRSFWISEVPMGLCSRCTGIYLGMLISLCFFLFNKRDIAKKHLPMFLLFLIPLLIDGTLQYIGLYLSYNLIRFATGLLFGVAIGCLITYLISLTKRKEFI